MWSSTPWCRTPWVCRVNMRLSLERSTEASCFLQAGSIAKCPLPEVVQAY